MTVKKTQVQKTAEKANRFRYLVTKFNEKGWVEAKAANPIPFDLVTVETDTGKKVAAWWNKSYWKGLHLKKEDTVLRWKRRRYERIT